MEYVYSIVILLFNKVTTNKFKQTFGKLTKGYYDCFKTPRKPNNFETFCETLFFCVFLDTQVSLEPTPVSQSWSVSQLVTLLDFQSLVATPLFFPLLLYQFSTTFALLLHYFCTSALLHFCITRIFQKCIFQKCIFQKCIFQKCIYLKCVFAK